MAKDFIRSELKRCKDTGDAIMDKLQDRHEKEITTLEAKHREKVAGLISVLEKEKYGLEPSYYTAHVDRLLAAFDACDGGGKSK